MRSSGSIHFILSVIFFTSVGLFAPSVSYSNTCKEFYKKKSQFETFKKMLEGYRSIVLRNADLAIDKIPTVNFHNIKDAKFEKTDGMGNSGSYTGKLEHSDVFVKISNFGNSNAGFAQRSLNNVYNEIKFALILYKLGLGPKFFGVTTTPNGSIGLVYERINGKPVQLIESYTALSDKQWEKLKVIEIILNASGIRPKDFSFIADRNGSDLYIIDSEFYKIVLPYDPNISFSFHANRNGIGEILD